MTQSSFFRNLRNLILCLTITVVTNPCYALSSDDSDSRPTDFGELRKYNRQRTDPGFTLYPIRKSEVLLLNAAGKTVHRWKVKSVRTRLLSSCNIIVIHDSKGLHRNVTEYDWNGNVSWEYRAPKVAHHDVRRLPNGHTIFPIRSRADYHPEPTEEDPEPALRKMRSDSIIEINQDKKIVWKWDLDKHIDPHSCGARKCPAPYNSKTWIKSVRDWSHLNTVYVLPDNKWYRAGDSRFRPGNVMLLPRNLWTVYIVDRQTDEVVWQYSGDYKGGMRFPHESHMIPEGFPGAGNILIFDNGRKGRGSIALEIDPLTKQIVWAFEDGMNFYSKGHGSLQRLPNGNTLISEDGRGRVFEVTPDKEIVWDFKAPAALRRAQRYATNHCDELTKLPLE